MYKAVLLLLMFLSLSLRPSDEERRERIERIEEAMKRINRMSSETSEDRIRDTIILRIRSLKVFSKNNSNALIALNDFNTLLQNPDSAVPAGPSQDILKRLGLITDEGTLPDNVRQIPAQELLDVSSN
jgi:hypothetical protein